MTAAIVLAVSFLTREWLAPVSGPGRVVRAGALVIGIAAAELVLYSVIRL